MSIRTDRPGDVGFGISDDYAVLYGHTWSFYYGYETAEEDGDWQFECSIDGAPGYKMPWTEMGLPGNDRGSSHGLNPEEILIYGIGQFMDQLISKLQEQNGTSTIR